MFIAALAVLVCTICAQYAPQPPYTPQPSPSYNGSSGVPTPAYSPSSYYYPKPPYESSYYPEYPAPHEFVEYHCDYCPRLKLSCKNSPGCFKPTVKYLEHYCKAVVTCDDSFGEDVQLTTNYGEVLSEGLGISKFILCKRGKWVFLFTRMNLRIR
uniref:Uncharacterized protein n=1 Tax=Angiostrongylus cantonensis TaxID=6313 RepID=A0A0K0D655_ANGCA